MSDAKFRVTVRELHEYELEVDAVDYQDAEQKAYDIWNDGNAGYASLSVECEAEEL